jgi:methyl-accepting chemotaxis protein
MKFQFKKSGILAKLLLPTSGIFIAAVVILVTVVIQMQGNFVGHMGQSVTDALQSTTTSVQRQLAEMESNVGETLQENVVKASDTLSRNTSAELAKIQTDITADLQQTLKLNGESMASLLAHVAPRAILSSNFTDLMSYVKSVTKRPDVVYAIYLNPKGRPITRYVNRKDPKIKSYLKSGAAKRKLDKVLNGSQNDSSVMVVEKEMVLEGKSLGKIVLCLDKSSVLEKKKEVESQFASLTKKNADMIRSALTKVSSETGAMMETTLHEISKQSNDTWAAIEETIDQMGQKAKSRMQRTMIGIGLVFGLAVISVIGTLAFVMVLKPINQVIAGLKDIATGEGDLTKRLEINSKDEIGTLARWFNQFVDNLQLIIKDLASNAQDMRSSSAELSEISQTMSVGSRKTSDKATGVAEAGDQMRYNMNSVASAMEEATTNLNMVVTAVEEMTATINEIAQTSESARNKTDTAMHLTNSTSQLVGQLGDSAQEIGKVVEAITEISDQVNLLALNATIEAARAGAAGKGFAVVANEIKELASQTQQSTNEIKHRVSDIQNSTGGTVTKINEIVSAFGEVNDLVGVIATAIEEQSVTTKEISGNLSQANNGINDVNENVNNSSTAASRVADDIEDVKHASGEMLSSSSQINQNAEQLSKLSEQLASMVGRFRI